MTADETQQPTTEIHRIELVAAVPPSDQRDPYTLYIPQNEGVPERDQHLGAFMDRWSGLERTLLILLWPLLESTYQAAEVLFYSATSIKAQTDMITGLVALKHPQQAARWRKLASECLTLSNNRNHLVHGHWIPKYVVGSDEKERPIVKKIKWARVYMTGDPDLNARATHPTEEPKTGQHSYPLERIRRKIEQTVKLANDIDAFRKKLYGEGLPAR